MADWRLESYDRHRKFLGVLPHSNLQGEFFGDKADQIRFDVPQHHEMVTPITLSAGINEIWAYRNDVLVYAGPLWDMTINDARISCTSEGLESYFELRRIQNDVAYNGNRTTVAWDLIAKSQALPDSDLGIVQGTVDPAGAIAIRYWGSEGRIISETLADLSAEGEFDFKITPNRQANFIYPKRQATSRSRLIFPGSIKNYSIQINGKWALNDIYVRGNGAFVTPVIDTAKRAQYGSRQGTVTNSNLKSLTQLANYADEMIKLRRDSRWLPTITIDASIINPFDGDISYGDIVQVTIDDGWVAYDGPMRVAGWQVTVDKGGNESVNLYMNDMREIEEST